MTQIDSQWRTWVDWIASQQVHDGDAPNTWLGWPTGPHIRTHHVVNFLAQLRTKKGERPAFSTFRSYKAHLVEILRKSGGLLDYTLDSEQMKLLEDLTEEKKRHMPDKAKHENFYEIDPVIQYLKVEGKFNADSRSKLRRERTATLLRLHSLARSDDLAKMRLGSLLESKEKQEANSSHWVYDDQEQPDKPTGVTLFVPDAKTDSPFIQIGATPEEPQLCVIKELQRHCAWIKSIPAEERQGVTADDPDKVLFISAKPSRVGVTPSGIIKRHTPLQASTIAGDVLSVLSKAGIDTEKWKAHSLRGAAATHMFDKGVHVEKILALGRWASASTFEKYYKRAKKMGTFSVAQDLIGESSANMAPTEHPQTVHTTNMGGNQLDESTACQPSEPFKEGSQSRDSKGVNTVRPIPEAKEGHNNANCHCWSCNAKDARMIHCKICNIHLHRHHFGDSAADHRLAEAEFLQEGWQCESCCDSITSWSTYNLRTKKKSTEQRLRDHKLWHVGSLNREQMRIAESIMKEDC